MSQAFVKEGDASDDLPERPVSSRPNYVTAEGLDQLKAKLQELAEAVLRQKKAKRADSDQALKVLERDLRYYELRLSGAILVKPLPEKPREVRFGTTVELSGPEGVQRWTIVGEDEADPAQGKLSWSSPLSLALMGRAAGDSLAWPEGSESELKVLSIE